MVNALLSLTKYYEFPLPIFVSHRGIYKEKIAAQIPMGSLLPKLLDAIDIEHITITDPSDLVELYSELDVTFQDNKVKCFLISPKVCEVLKEDVPCKKRTQLKKSSNENSEDTVEQIKIIEDIKDPVPRIQMLKDLKPYLKNKAVISNMGYPSRELFSVFDQPSNFYMLGSLGLASSIGLGVSLFSESEVVVIDGDGSLLMNPNALLSIGGMQPKNLTLICLDNGAYGSTGNQPTWAASGLRLEELASASGFNNIYVSDSLEILDNVKGPGPNFVRLGIQSGNADVGIIDIPPLELKTRFQNWLRSNEY